MFRSQLSKKVFKGSPVLVVTHKRKRTYTEQNRYGQDIPVGQGWEIVKEISVAPSEVEAVKAQFGDGVFVD